MSLFVVHLPYPLVRLSPNGLWELSDAAWRPIPYVLANLGASRTPAAAGRAYATALRRALAPWEL